MDGEGGGGDGGRDASDRLVSLPLPNQVRCPAVTRSVDAGMELPDDDEAAAAILQNLSASMHHLGSSRGAHSESELTIAPKLAQIRTVREKASFTMSLKSLRATGRARRESVAARVMPSDMSGWLAVMVCATALVFLVGVGVFCALEPDRSAWDVTYQVAQVVTYTGYGDEVPRSKGVRLALGVYALVSVAFMWSTSFVLTATWLEWVDSARGGIFPRVHYALCAAFVACSVAGMAALFQAVEPRMGYQEAAYFASASLSGIGYGDVVAETDEGRALAVSLLGIIGMPFFSTSSYILVEGAWENVLAPVLRRALGGGRGDGDEAAANGHRGSRYRVAPAPDGRYLTAAERAAEASARGRASLAAAKAEADDTEMYAMPARTQSTGEVTSAAAKLKSTPPGGHRRAKSSNGSPQASAAGATKRHFRAPFRKRSSLVSASRTVCSDSDGAAADEHPLGDKAEGAREEAGAVGCHPAGGGEGEGGEAGLAQLRDMAVTFAAASLAAAAVVLALAGVLYASDGGRHSFVDACQLTAETIFCVGYGETNIGESVQVVLTVLAPVVIGTQVLLISSFIDTLRTLGISLERSLVVSAGGVLAVVAYSAAVFLAEGGSAADGVYFGTCTVTTVGLGDVMPESDAARMALLPAFAGIFFFFLGAVSTTQVLCTAVMRRYYHHVRGYPLDG